MKARFIKVKVHKDAMSEIMTEVPEYELKLLQAVNGSDVVGDDPDESGSVVKVGDTGVVYVYESASDVYDALKEKYRSNSEGKLWVDDVFGDKGKFIAELKKIDVEVTKSTKAAGAN